MVKDHQDIGNPVYQGFLTSILQVFNICTKQEFKALIKKLYMTWKSKFLKSEISKTPNNPNRRINFKIQVTEMTETLEEATNFSTQPKIPPDTPKIYFITAAKIYGRNARLN